MKTRITILAIIASVLSACAGEDSEPSASLRQADTVGIPKASSVPYPIQVDPVTWEPVIDDRTGKPISAWDASYAELLAADAYVQCVNSATGFSERMLAMDSQSGDGNLALRGTAIDKIADEMAKSPCPVDHARDCYDPPDNICYGTPTEEWMFRRTTAQCNISPSTGENVAALTLPPMDPKSPVVRFEAWSEQELAKTDHSQRVFRYPTEGPGNDWLSLAVFRVYGDVFAATVDLCMAQRMTTVLEDADVLSATDDEHMMILGLARERAQAAMLRFAHILKIRTRQDVPETADTEYTWTPVLYHWMVNDPGDGSTDKPPVTDIMLANFVRSIRLANATTTAFAAYLERQAGARWTSSGSRDAFQRDYGPESARSRLMAVLYGGDPLGDMWGEKDWSSGLPYFAPVREGSDDPRVSVLLSLAREADALYVAHAPDGEGYQINPKSWERIYSEVEAALRLNECAVGEEGCDRETVLASLPHLEDEHEYLLKQRFDISLEHAKSLANGLFDAVIRPGALIADFRASGRFHASGTISESTSNWGGVQTWLKLDPDTRFLPYAVGSRRSPNAECAAPEATWTYGLGKCDNNVVPREFWKVGAISGLAFSREVLFKLAAVAPENPDLAAVLAEVERMTGPTTVLLRAANYVDVLRRADEPGTMSMVSYDYGSVNAGLAAAAIDPNYVGLDGISRANLDSQIGATGNAAQGSGYAENLTHTSFEGIHESGKTFLLRTTDEEQNSYRYLGMLWSAYVDEGWLANLAQRITAVDELNWSRPRYDGFGLETNWVPPADASLIGGTAGEESYAYLLRSAKTAAEEATSAVKTAIEKISEEVRDETALAQTEKRAEGILSQELAALCGRVPNCLLERAMMSFTIGEGDPDASEATCTTDMDAFANDTAKTQCEVAKLTLNTALPDNIPVPRDVMVAADNASADFGQYGGTELQRVLTRIWNAVRALRANATQSESLARTHGYEYARLARAMAEAEATKGLAKAQEDELWPAAETECLDDDSGLRCSEVAVAKAEVEAAEERARDMRHTAKQKLRLECKWDGTWVDTFTSCAAYDGPGHCHPAECSARSCTATETPDDYRDVGENVAKSVADFCLARRNSCHMTRENETSWAANRRCFDAARAYKEAFNDLDYQNEIGDMKIAQLNWLAELRAETVVRMRKLASQQYKTAEMTYATGMAEADAQLNAHMAVTAQVVGELMASLVEYEQLKTKVTQVGARAQLEMDLATSTLATNADLRRTYRSYDLWRARTLLENARRLAAAARRGIEARFVVDLSTLEADQAFVASPAVWADEVYESDLNAPAVVGLSVVPEQQGTIYPNKLLDYVGNLERFVQGYTMTYPTSVSLPDTEVLTIPGPDQSDSNAILEGNVLRADSTGWRFYCPNTGEWIAHPGMGEMPMETSLSTVCGGHAPTYARFGFVLDSWGRKNGAWTQPVYRDRHNVRWRRLAVNLVGTGVRNCENATDPTDCYTNPFIRFDLVHAGPSWQTDYAQQWRHVQIPTAYIEGGKSLAAEEWLEPVGTSWNMPFVSNVARGELFGRPVAGTYELFFEITPDVRLDRIERVQILAEQDYWVRQSGQGVIGPDPDHFGADEQAGAGNEGGASGTGGQQSDQGGAPGQGGSGQGGSGTGGSGTGGAGQGGAGGSGLYGECTATGTTSLIDNFADANRQIGTSEGRLGFWYGFHAGTSCTAVPQTGEAFLPELGTSGYRAHTSGTGCDAGNWKGGGIGFFLLSSYIDGVSTVCPGTGYDASQYTGIEFSAKGSGTLRVEVCITDLEDDNCHGADITLGPTWPINPYSISWGELSQDPNWGVRKDFKPERLRKIQWLTKNSPNYDFYLDNVYFRTQN